MILYVAESRVAYKWRDNFLGAYLGWGGGLKEGENKSKKSKKRWEERKRKEKVNTAVSLLTKTQILRFAHAHT